jgi:hypothetical protein
MAEVAKLTEEELKAVQELVSLIRRGENAVGALEVQKSSMLSEIKEIQDKLNEQRVALEEKYGQIEINLETGEYTVVDSEKEA